MVMSMEVNKSVVNEMNEAFALSDFYQLLSLSLQFPSKELVTAIDNGELREDILLILEDLSCSQHDIQGIAQSIDKNTTISAEERHQQMKQEYTRLFSDPKNPQMPIYESLFYYQLEEEGEKPMLFLSPEAKNAEKVYQEAGVKVDQQFREPADHFATELEFMMFLYGNKGKALQEQDDRQLEDTNKRIEAFRKNHLDKWENKFFEMLEQNTTLEFYKIIAKIAKIGLGRLDSVAASH